MPSLKFIKSLEGYAGLVGAAAGAWEWIGTQSAPVAELSVCCDCKSRCGGMFDLMRLPMSMPDYVVVRLRSLLYRTRFRQRRFWIGQCHKCELIYWGLATRKPETLARPHGNAIDA